MNAERESTSSCRLARSGPGSALFMADPRRTTPSRRKMDHTTRLLVSSEGLRPSDSPTRSLARCLHENKASPTASFPLDQSSANIGPELAQHVPDEPAEESVANPTHPLRRRRPWPRQQRVKVSGIHYLQEDSPTEIEVAIARFIKDLPSR